MVFGMEFACVLFRSCFTSSALGCTQDKVLVQQMFMSPAGGRWLCATVCESLKFTVGFRIKNAIYTFDSITDF